MIDRGERKVKVREKKRLEIIEENRVTEDWKELGALTNLLLFLRYCAFIIIYWWGGHKNLKTMILN